MVIIACDYIHFKYNIIMHKVKSLIAVLVFVLVTIGMGVSVFFSIAGDSKADYIVETNAFFAPFEYYDNRQIVGVDIEIVNRVAEKLNKKIQINNVEFDVIIDNVEAGRIADAGAAGLTITPAREEKVNFTIPYYNSVQYVIFNRQLFSISPLLLSPSFARFSFCICNLGTW